MTKRDFLAGLEKALKACRVEDQADILAEYEQHFARKTADGYGEEEVAARLENPEALARQFAQAGSGAREKPSLVAGVGLSVLSPFVLIFLAALLAWILAMGALSLASAFAGFCLVAAMDPTGLLPSMPYAGSFIMGISLLALSVLGATGTAYSTLFLLQLNKAYFHWAGNVLRSPSRAYPPIPLYPELAPSFRRRLRALALIALALFGTSFVLAYIVLASQAGSLEFWHVWHWFG